MTAPIAHVHKSDKGKIRKSVNTFTILQGNCIPFEPLRLCDFWKMIQKSQSNGVSKLNTKRPKSVAFRLSESEFSQLQERIKNSGMTSQEFLLRSALDKPILEKSVYQAFLLELRRQGVNLNQLVRACNVGNIDIPGIEKLIKELEEKWLSLKL